MYLTILKEMSQQLQSYFVRECGNGEAPMPSGKAKDDVKGGPLDPHEVQNCPPQEDSVFVGQKRVRVCN